MFEKNSNNLKFSQEAQSKRRKKKIKSRNSNGIF